MLLTIIHYDIELYNKYKMLKGKYSNIGPDLS